MQLSRCSVAAISLLLVPNTVEGHGHMTSPRSRNWVAYEDGSDSSGAAGVPPKEYCYHCLNTKAANDVCGVGTQNYDQWLDVDGNPIPWDSQATYTEGDIIEVKSYLDTPHWGHQDVMICADGNASTQDCFEANPLEFVEDVSYGAPKDPNYPGRGHFTGNNKDFTMKFKLPMGVTGEKVLMQWRYVTANNCWPPGYENYPYEQAKGGNSATCNYPLDPTGATGTGNPEQFWNCAELTILPSGPTPPTTPPPTSPPSPTLPPVSVPAPNPPSGEGCCSWPPFQECSQPQNTWCQESKDRCEGSCSGKWLYDDAPQPAPVAQPIAAPVASPVKQPSPGGGGGRGCCSINFKTCHHPVDTFCWESEENCRGPCGKFWLPTGAIDGCTAQFDSCSSDAECCYPGTCDGGQCTADGWDYTAHPTNPPGSVPTAPVPIAAPTATSHPSLRPTTPSTNLPTKKSPTTSSPTKAFSGDDKCCTWDFYHCGVSDLCNENEQNCHGTCGGVWLEKADPAMQCIEKYGQCTSALDGCCNSLTCSGNDNYKQCL